MNANRSMSRRSFLAWTAAAAPLAASRTARASSANDTVRIGLIGCGARGLELLERAKAHGGAVTAVCDVFEPRRQRAEALAQARAHTDWRSVLDRKDLDAVIVATPDHWHAAMAVAAMESGKDVYCETPMAHTLEEAKAFRDAALRTRRVVQIGAERASHPQWAAAAELVRSGAVGTLVWSQGGYARPGAAETPAPRENAIATPATLDWQAFLGSSPAREFDPHRFYHWRNYWDYSSGAATEALYDKLAALLIATGERMPERVSAAGGVYTRDGREAPDTFVMSAEYPGGHTIVLASSMANDYGLPAVIRGERATLELRGDSIKIVPELSNGEPAETIRVASGPDHLGQWLDCIRSRESCACDAALGYHATVAMTMAAEACRTARTLRYDAATETVFPETGRVIA